MCFSEKVETPHEYLLENRHSFDEQPFGNVTFFTDVISLIHQMLRVSIKEPVRTKVALGHIEAGVGQAKEMWNFITAEKDDDNEWIPNPQQAGVVGIDVTQAMVDAWRESRSTSPELVLKGTRLIPFWARQCWRTRCQPAPSNHRVTDVRCHRMGAGDCGHALSRKRGDDKVRRSQYANTTQQRIRRPVQYHRLWILVQLTFHSRC